MEEHGRKLKGEALGRWRKTNMETLGWLDIKVGTKEEEEEQDVCTPLSLI
jgi:hypothetical protein